MGEVLFKSHSIVPPSAAVGRGVTSVKETELFLCRSSKKFSDSHLCSQSSNVNMKPVKKCSFVNKGATESRISRYQSINYRLYIKKTDTVRCILKPLY